MASKKKGESTGDAALHRELLHSMILQRRVEEKVAEAYALGKIGGFCHLYIGQEAVGTGVMSALRHDDYVITTYRDHGQALARGMSARSVMAELFGRIDGCSRGKGGSMHLFDRSVGFLGGHGIVGGHGRIYCLDKLPASAEDKLKRRGSPLPTNYRVAALDAVTGKLLWEETKNIFGSWLSYSKQHDVLLQRLEERADHRPVQRADAGEPHSSASLFLGRQHRPAKNFAGRQQTLGQRFV